MERRTHVEILFLFIVKWIPIDDLKIMFAIIRKFGLEYCDLPTMVWNVTVLLRLLILDIDTQSTKGIPLIIYIFTTVIAICYFYMYVVSVVWFVFVRCQETGDIVVAMTALSLGIASKIGVSKLVYMYLKKDLVMSIVTEFLHHDSKVVPETRFAKNLHKTLRVVKRRAFVFWVTIMSNGTIYCIIPLFLPGRHLMEDTFIAYGLEPTYESPNYEITYFASLCGVAFTCYLAATITVFFMVFTGYTEAQITALSDEMTHIWEDATVYHRNNYNKKVGYGIGLKKKTMNEYINIKLKEVIKRHTTNVNLLRQIDQFIRGAIAIDFVFLTLGLIAELLGGLEKTYLEIPFTVVLVAMDCLMGQKVMDACVIFENAVYYSNWENFDTSNMKIALMMLQNAQKTVTLSAGGITILSFTSLMSILRSVYSAYTTLRTAVNKT